ncbi:MAG: aldo/keto reductase [Thaumarchaeota archaeon]|nr:aldo/keto reductase [Nitrososphaerota archaeon]
MAGKLGIDGFASEEGTRNFAAKAVKLGVLREHFRSYNELTLSSLGMGTYLGETDRETDILVSKAVEESVRSGAINVIDTAINYRFQKAERSVGNALRKMVEGNSVKRNEIFLATKNGYLTPDGDLKMDFWKYVHENLVKTNIIKPNEISSGMHCMSVNYLKDQLQRSLRNLGVECVDLMYLHNAAEAQLNDISMEEFFEKLMSVFTFYEDMRKEGKIRYYGLATWSCFRLPADDPEYLSLSEVVSVAKEVDDDHGFKFIQLPFNLGMKEAFMLRNQNVDGEMLSTLEAAKKLGLGVFTSVPLLQGRLLNPRTLPNIEGIDKPALKCLQIARSAPIICPLVGQKDSSHVKENVQIAKLPFIEYERLASLISSF